MARFGMVIDLQKCVGCGACAIACKTENNTDDAVNGQTHNWADFIFHSEGEFPDVKAATLPVLCNHCTKAPCVEACPVEPTAMFKTASGITMHNNDRCIGCQQCQEACPYSRMEVEDGNTQYSVISFNESAKDQYRQWKSAEELLEHQTASGAEVSRRVEQMPPHRTMFKHPDYGSVRRSDVVEKCIFCEHRVKNGEEPYCVVSCPSRARVIGDLDNEKSTATKLIKKHGGFRLKEDEGTEPNVYYIRKFGMRG